MNSLVNITLMVSLYCGTLFVSVCDVCRGMESSLGIRVLLLMGLNRGIESGIQITRWTEPVLMLILGIALLMAAQGIRQWVRKKIKL